MNQCSHLEIKSEENEATCTCSQSFLEMYASWLRFVYIFVFRWDEDTIELAQMWVPKDISKDKVKIDISNSIYKSLSSLSS